MLTGASRITRRDFTRSVLAGGLLACAGCAGYQFGNQTLYPSDIHTVFVPVFESDSFRRDLGERLTEAVVKEIELKTPYKVVGSPNADSILSGRIVSDKKGVLAETINGDVRELELSMTVKVNWVNRKGNLVGRGQPGAGPGEFATVTATANDVPEFGRSIATTQQVLIERLARQIVALMESPW
ncbi:MAG TPA: LptE family protein [Pirellulales bacterium]|jgi:outer membrane lipopolysaccharide assembly protein LptE/RlpB|nr:LptE family protein [Pirellulales bacterium]